MHLTDYGGFFLFFGVMVGVGLLLIVVSHLAQIAVKGDKYDWTRPYECGISSSGHKLDRYPIHYYLVGILFVIFDVEALFFVPWAVASRDFLDAGAGWYWWLVMLPFLIILIVGFVYEIQTGILEWGKEEEVTTA